MGRKTWIDSDIWIDTEDLNITERLFYIYLLTNNQHNVGGYYKISLEHTALDMQMSKNDVLKLLKKKQKYWQYDADTGQVLIPKYTKHNICKSTPQLKKLNAELSSLRTCYLHKEFLEAFEECNGIGAKELIDAKFREKAKPFYK